MDKLNFDQLYGVWLFKLEDSPFSESSLLKHYLNFLKTNRISDSLQFAYVPRIPNLISNLDINENMQLHYERNSLTLENEEKLESLLKQKKCPKLKKLYLTIHHMIHERENNNKELLKLVNLFNAFISDYSFIFLEYPEVYLSTESLNLVKDIIDFKVNNKRNHFFITTTYENLFLSSTSHIVTRNDNFTFHVESIMKDERASNKNPGILRTSHLKFYYPTKKKSAA